MKNLILTISLLASIIFIAGCGSSKTNLTNTDTGDIPAWYLNPPSDSAYFYAGVSETSRDMQLAIDKAMTSARANIARQVETKITGLEKQFKEEVGSGDNSQLLSQFTQATKTITDQKLNGTHVEKQKIIKDGNTFRVYVLVDYPIGAANEFLMQQLKKNEQMYTRFRSSQTFKDLDNEVQKYEDAKKNQN